MNASDSDDLSMFLPSDVRRLTGRFVEDRPVFDPCSSSVHATDSIECMYVIVVCCCCDADAIEIDSVMVISWCGAVCGVGVRWRVVCLRTIRKLSECCCDSGYFYPGSLFVQRWITRCVYSLLLTRSFVL